MRCSLLVLSGYIDDELENERTGELEAHLVGCTRCSTALGYLREETERVSALDHVHVDDRAARELFALIGLNGDSAPETPWHDDEPPAPDPTTWAAGSSAAELAWAPHTVPVPPAYEPPPIEPDVHLDPHPGIELEAEPYHELEARAEHDPAPEPEPEPEPDPDPQPDPIAESDHAEPWAAATTAGEAAAPPAPPLPTYPPGPVARFINRVRDSVSVRRALMRGTAHDDGYQIVSGDGAPHWEGRPVNRSYQERMARRRGVPATPVAPPAASVQPDEDDADEELEATGRAVPPPELVQAPVAVASGIAAAAAVATTQARIGTAPPPTAPVNDAPRTIATETMPVEPPVATPPGAAPEVPVTPGRHMRTVARGTGNGSSRAGGIGSLTAAVARRTGARHGPAVGVTGVDRRLWIVAGALAILMLVGILLGKSSVPLATTGAHHGAAPTALPQASAPPATVAPSPTAAPTPTPAPPTPTPAARPALPKLTGVQAIGSGASGISIIGIHYALHPGGIETITFDFSIQGRPKVVAGFANATTLYVEINGAGASRQPIQPAGHGYATKVQLLQPSPVRDAAVYVLTLKHSVTMSLSFSGARLVVSLK